MVKRPTKADPATEQRILAAAHDVFTRRGTAGARTQEIADEAGVNKALLHYYFGTKERLAQEVFARAAAGILPRIHGILTGEGSIEEKVESVIAAEYDFIARHPYLPGYVVAEINYNPERVMEVFSRRGPPPLDVLRAQLEAAAAAGELRPIAAEQFIASLMSLIFFPFAARPLLEAMLGIRGRFEQFTEERRQGLKAFFLGGLRP